MSPSNDPERWNKNQLTGLTKRTHNWTDDSEHLSLGFSDYRVLLIEVHRIDYPHQLVWKFRWARSQTFFLIILIGFLFLPFEMGDSVEKNMVVKSVIILVKKPNRSVPRSNAIPCWITKQFHKEAFESQLARKPSVHTHCDGQAHGTEINVDGLNSDPEAENY